MIHYHPFYCDCDEEDFVPSVIEVLKQEREQLNQRLEYHPEDRTSENYRRREQIDARLRKLQKEEE